MKNARMATASAGAALVLVLVGCTADPGREPGTPGVTTVVSTVTESAPPDDAGESTPEPQTDAPAPTTPEVPPPNPHTYFSGLQPVDVAAYLKWSSGTTHGARFTSPTGNISCHLTKMAAACRVAEHEPWPPAERANVGAPDTPSNVVGWVADFGLTGRPVHWAQQGTFPASDVDGVLVYGHQLTMERYVNNTTSHVTCGSRVEAVTCIIDGGAHGFTVSRETYRTW